NRVALKAVRVLGHHRPRFCVIAGVHVIVLRQLDAQVVRRKWTGLDEVAAGKQVAKGVALLLDVLPVNPVPDAVDAEPDLETMHDGSHTRVDGISVPGVSAGADDRHWR